MRSYLPWSIKHGSNFLGQSRWSTLLSNSAKKNTSFHFRRSNVTFRLTIPKLSSPPLKLGLTFPNLSYPQWLPCASSHSLSRTSVCCYWTSSFPPSHGQQIPMPPSLIFTIPTADVPVSVDSNPKEPSMLHVLSGGMVGLIIVVAKALNWDAETMSMHPLISMTKNTRFWR